MSAPQLDLEWREEPNVGLRGGVVDAFVAYCGCGWRYSASIYSRKENRLHAEEQFARHRERFCPVAAAVASLPPAEVYGARLLQEPG